MNVVNWDMQHTHLARKAGWDKVIRHGSNIDAYQTAATAASGLARSSNGFTLVSKSSRPQTGEASFGWYKYGDAKDTAPSMTVGIGFDNSQGSSETNSRSQTTSLAASLTVSYGSEALGMGAEVTTTLGHEWSKSVDKTVESSQSRSNTCEYTMDCAPNPNGLYKTQMWQWRVTPARGNIGSIKGGHLCTYGGPGAETPVKPKCFPNDCNPNPEDNCQSCLSDNHGPTEGRWRDGKTDANGVWQPGKTSVDFMGISMTYQGRNFPLNSITPTTFGIDKFGSGSADYTKTLMTFRNGVQFKPEIVQQITPGRYQDTTGTTTVDIQGHTLTYHGQTFQFSDLDGTNFKISNNFGSGGGTYGFGQITWKNGAKYRLAGNSGPLAGDWINGNTALQIEGNSMVWVTNPSGPVKYVISSATANSFALNSAFGGGTATYTSSQITFSNGVSFNKVPLKKMKNLGSDLIPRVPMCQ
jgi:hypothetical protein